MGFSTIYKQTVVTYENIRVQRQCKNCFKFSCDKEYNGTQFL